MITGEKLITEIMKNGSNDIPINLRINNLYYEIADFYFDKSINEYQLFINSPSIYNKIADIVNVYRIKKIFKFEDGKIHFNNISVKCKDSLEMKNFIENLNSYISLMISTIEDLQKELDNLTNKSKR